MLFDEVLKNPVVKKAIAAGEEQAGKVVGKLLASDAVATGLSNLLSAASAARATFDAGVQTALKAANLPSSSEVQALKQKIEELESLIDELSARVDSAPGHEDDPPGGGRP